MNKQIINSENVSDEENYCLILSDVSGCELRKSDQKITKIYDSVTLTSNYNQLSDLITTPSTTAITTTSENKIN